MVAQNHTGVGRQVGCQKVGKKVGHHLWMAPFQERQSCESKVVGLAQLTDCQTLLLG